MNEIENVVNYVGNDQVKCDGNDQVKFDGNEQINNSFTQNINESCTNNEPIKNVESFTSCEPENSTNNEVKLNTECIPKKSVGICEPIAVREQISTSNNVPGIEYLLHNDMRNASMENHASVRNYQQLGNSEQIDKFNLSADSMQRRENNGPMVSSVSNNCSNVVVNTLDGTVPTVSKELSVPRKPVGIREPIAMREQISTTNNVPGIEYLLHNDMRNPSMRNLEYVRNYEQFRSEQVTNGKFNLNMEAVTRREYKNEPMVTSISNNPSNVLVFNRSMETGPAVSRELSVPRKPVGIREPIAMREPISNPNTVPGIEYNEIPAENLIKKSRIPKEERPFLCTTCGNKFRQQSHLQQHVRIHTNDRPYQCSFCEKAFKQKSQLNQHERIHTGEKPYKCVICEKAFAQAGQLYSHKKTHGLNINEIKAQRDGRERTPRKRGRRAKVEEIPSTEIDSPPSVIYIMEPHPRPPSSHFQFPRPVNEFHSHLFNNGFRYPSDKLPKIETVVSLGTRPRMLTPPPVNTTPQLYHWRHDTSKGSHPGT